MTSLSHIYDQVGVKATPVSELMRLQDRLDTLHKATVEQSQRLHSLANRLFGEAPMGPQVAHENAVPGDIGRIQGIVSEINAALSSVNDAIERLERL
jgi:hypothetical protein